MTDYEINVPGDLLSSLLSEQDGLAKLLETVLNQLLDAQASEQGGAGRYERAEERAAYRNGYRPRQLYTRVGPLTLRVSQMRNVLSHTTAKHKQARGEGLKRIFRSDNGKEARQKFNELAAQMEKKAAVGNASSVFSPTKVQPYA